MTIERLEFKAAFTADETGLVEGKAWDFSGPDRVGDEISPSAFASAVGKSLPMLFAHDQAQVLGTWDSVSVDSEGLKVKGRLLVKDVARAAEVRALLVAQSVTGLSVGFMTKKAAPRKGGGRTITDLDLVEVSLVAVPAHNGARISTIKAAGQEDTTMTATAENTVIDTKAIEALEVKLAARIEAIEAKANRLQAEAANDNDDAEFEEKALRNYLRNGAAGLADEDKKTLNLGTPAAGGYVTAPTISTTVIEKLVQFSPIRQLASVLSIGTTEIWLPKLDTPLVGGWVGETATRPSGEPVFGQQKIETGEYAVVVPISQQLIEDSFIDLNSYLSGQIARQFGKAEATALYSGSGTNQPTGLMNNPALFGQTVANQNGSDLIAKIIELFYSLPGAYAANGSWLMNRKTMGLIRAAADNATKGTLWSELLANGTPASLLGRPIYDSVDAADFAPTVAADTFPVLFGDIASAYQVIDRVQTQLFVDPYTGADSGIVKIRARKRVGGEVVLPEAVVVLKSDAA